MANWWEQAYKGGPMVAVRGFPRPLYPPSAAPQHQPSVNGSDVEGLKRGISRGGRWRWQPFDQAFSNGFSAGRGPNVIDSGIAGFQRQMKIQPTGFVGVQTFNAIRSALVPVELPNGGQPLLDARAVELINAAWDRFGGSESAGGGGSSSAQARLKNAQSQIGVKENPANSNRVVYSEWYSMIGPWCAMFVTWCDLTGARPRPATFVRGQRYAYVPYVLNDARMGRYGLTVTSTPRPGDLVLYDWDGTGQEYDHIGIFESGSSSSWAAIEGNTSTSNQSNGGQVMRRQRSRNDAAVVFVRVAE